MSPSPPPPPPPTAASPVWDRTHRRYHGLDFIRASMMMLGVVLHTALVYLPTDKLPGAWLYQDPDSSPVMSVLLAQVIHIFRMPVFFVMAGFFGAMLFERKGVGTFFIHRFDRIVIPLVIGWFVLYPLFCWSLSFALTYSLIPAGGGALAEAFERMSFDADFGNSGPLHLWFLYYLVYFYVVFGALTVLIRRFAGPLVRPFRYCISGIVTGRCRWLRMPILVAVTTPLMLTMAEPGLDTPMGWAPVWHILAVYSVYFGVGWIVYEHREVVVQLERWSWARLFLSIVLLAVALVLTFHYKSTTADWKAGSPIIDLGLLFCLIQLVEVASVWLLVLALTGVCERLFRSEVSWVRYLVDASYWIYLMHLPLTLFIPGLFRYWNIDGTVKMFVMMALVTIPLIITYHLLVRGTAVGVVLNGRRYPVWPFSHKRRPAPQPME
ncbi:MAG: acyltransferase family protein [Planctomycetota bacterium]|nr:acyltransferase family protein [Planctomycetota bacterium]